VLGNKCKAEDGYDAVVVGCREKKVDTMAERMKSRLAIGWCNRAKLGKLLDRITEFRVSQRGHLPVSTSHDYQW
jgi:ribosomal protein L3